MWCSLFLIQLQAFFSLHFEIFFRTVFYRKIVKGYLWWIYSNQNTFLNITPPGDLSCSYVQRETSLHSFQEKANQLKEKRKLRGQLIENARRQIAQSMESQTKHIIENIQMKTLTLEEAMAAQKKELEEKKEARKAKWVIHMKLFSGSLQNSCFEKFRKIHGKILAKILETISMTLQVYNVQFY